MADPVNKWAILIGIDDYGEHRTHLKPRTASDGTIKVDHMPDLVGCVRDVMHVEKYMIDVLNMLPSHIEKLVAPLPGSETNCGASEKAPTYDNIVKTLRDVVTRVEIKKGDFIYIHYSGHGARAKTVFSEWRKRAFGRRATIAFGDVEKEDHALVPCDVLDGGRFLRDLEFAEIVDTMVLKGLRLTVAFDCCHSGGTHRSHEGSTAEDAFKARGIEEVFDSTEEEEHEASEWIKNWAKDPYEVFYQPRGFVLLAACQPLQKAVGKSDGGAFTTELLRILRDAPLGLSSQALSDVVAYKVHLRKSRPSIAKRLTQTPMILGDPDLNFFNQALQARVYGFSIIEKDDQWRKLRLNGGLIHGVLKDSIYNIVPYVPVLNGREAKVLAKVRVVEVFGGYSLAKLADPEQGECWDSIAEGYMAVLHSLPNKQRFSVQFKMEKPLKDDCESHWREYHSSNAWLILGYGDSDAVGFQISVNKINCFTIGGQLGEVTRIMEIGIPGLPATKDDLKKSMASLVRILEHLAQYKLFKDISCPMIGRSQEKLISVQVRPATEPIKIGGELREPATNMQLAANTTNEYQVEEKRMFQFKVKNQVERKVHFVVLACSAEFSISKVYPSDMPYQTLTSRSNSNNQAEAPVDLGIIVADEVRKAVRSGWNAVETYKIIASVEAQDLMGLSSIVLESLRELDHSRKNLGEYFELANKVTDDEKLRTTFTAPHSQVPAEWQIEEIKVKATLGKE